MEVNRTVRLGAAARRRIKSGGVLSKGRPSLSLVEWNALKARVFLRAEWRCEHCKRRTRLEPHHVIKRSRGGEDTVDNVVALCGGSGGCHAWTDAPWASAKGRLIVAALGQRRFRFDVVTILSK